MDIEKYLKNGSISKIVETELERYIKFFTNSYQENLAHSKRILQEFPRWSIISGYYAMHDATKLFLAKNFGIKKMPKNLLSLCQEYRVFPQIFSLRDQHFLSFKSAVPRARVIKPRFEIKVNFQVHKTTIAVLRDILNDEGIINLIEKGYEEFITMANDLGTAKEERMQAQYYTGTEFMKEKYLQRTDLFLKNVVLPYLEKIKMLMGGT